MGNTGLLARYLGGAATDEHFLSAYRDHEPRLHAWVDMRLEESATEGPLRGAPYAAKDIVECAGYRNTWGTPVYADRMGHKDAALIEKLRAAGGRLMGKTQTTSFAYFDPSPTRNPRNHAHTPGGSSSGSAAAVAAGMVPFAIGTQTQGSILRPASYCGVVGFKPTFGLLPVEGIMPFAPTLDTPGFFTQTALDMRLLWRCLDYAADAELPAVYGMIEVSVEPEMQETFRHAIQILGQYGCQIRRVHAPRSFEELPEVVRLLQTYEGARTHAHELEQHGPAIGVKLSQLIRDGLALSETRYEELLGQLEQARTDMAAILAEYPVLLTTAAVGPAPAGLGSTGHPRCNAPWTGLGTPAISIPMPTGEELPMGLQMSAAKDNDALLLAAASHCQALLTAARED